MSVQNIPSSPPAFYLEILVFLYSLIIFAENPSGASSARTARPSNFVIILLVRVFIKATVREDRAPFFSYPPTASDETTFSVLFTIDVYHYLVIFDFIHVNSHLLE